jgi:hypothetical protein
MAVEIEKQWLVTWPLTLNPVELGLAALPLAVPSFEWKDW